MRKLFCLLALLFVFVVSAQAQRRGRLEVSGGPVYPLKSIDGYKNTPFCVFLVGYSRNVPASRLWLGTELGISAAARKVLEPISSSAADYESCRTFSFSFSTDFTFVRWDIGELQAGAALGVAQRATFCPSFSLDEEVGLFVNPRVSVILWDRMKVTLEGRLTHSFYDTVGMRVGYVF